jgi:hypothetical protein
MQYTVQCTYCIFNRKSCIVHGRGVHCLYSVLEFRTMGAKNRVGIGLSYKALICKSCKEPRNRFPAWRTGMIIIFIVPARQAT